MKLAATMPSTPLVQVRIDIRNLGILLVGFLGLLAIISPLRSFPITDDWTYARSVSDILHWHYRLDASQAIALGHIAWGALFAAIWGSSFTVLSIANLFMSAMGIVLFYLLLRQLEVTPAWALFGAALLGTNPIYLHLSYTFMTDVTFLVYLLLSCLCYLRGMRGHGEKWLWLGSIAVAWAFLTRQYGILLVPAALLYIWWSREWLWRKVIAVTLVPIIVAGLYMLWERTQPTPIIMYYLASLTAGLSPLDYWIDHGFRIAWALSIMGALLLPLITMPHRILRIAPFATFLGVFLIASWQRWGTFLPVTGNIIDNTGFLLNDYPAASIWSTSIWAILIVVGAIVFSLYMASRAEEIVLWLHTKPWREWSHRKAQNPILLLYILALMMLASILFLTPAVFDRYLLPVLPLLMIPTLRHNSLRCLKPNGLLMFGRMALAAPLFLFGLLAQRDFIQHSTVRWEEAESLVAQGIPREHINAGFEWQGWYLFDEGAERIRQKGDFSQIPFPAYAVLDPQYLLSDVPIQGYTEVSSQTYQSWLSGGETRYVLVLKREREP